ncbi:MAG: hypothetical protein ACRYHA_24025, partial [Janthinobacterium lividum]
RAARAPGGERESRSVPVGDLTQPRALAQGREGIDVVPSARNQMRLYSHRSLGSDAAQIVATLLSDKPDAARFALFLLSEKGQAIFSKHGLLPLLAGPAAP